MQVPIEHEDAKRRWPEAVEAVVAKLRKGKSKHRDADPSTLEWTIQWCVRVPAFSLGDVLSGRIPSPTSEERLKQNISDSTAWLLARKGRWSGASEALKELPQEVVDFYAKEEERRKTEEARIAALTPEERNRKIKDALATLSKGKGFVAVQVKRKDPQAKK